MSRYLLDTNILSYAIRKTHESLLQRLEQSLLDDSAAISVITYAETRYGQRLMDIKDKRQRAIDMLLVRLPVRPWTREAADQYARIKAELRQTGQPIGDLDTQIAAHALAEGLTLVTHNVRHFERVKGLTVEDWLV
jgi:tRNA(fMet)-specific endonuclease VapC